MATIHVLIADDHTLFREGLRALLASVPDIEVVGEAAKGQEVIELANKLRPDVVLMDIQMPDMSGIDATRHILKSQPQVGILILTMYEDDNSVFTAIRAGARGYVLKGADQVVLLRALRAVANGESLFSPSIAERLIDLFANPPRTSQAVQFPELTDREREILDLIAQGKTNDSISQQLIISVKTVRNHVSSIFNKLQVADRTQAALRAREAGFGSQPDVD